MSRFPAAGRSFEGGGRTASLGGTAQEREDPEGNTNAVAATAAGLQQCSDPKTQGKYNQWERAEKLLVM